MTQKEQITALEAENADLKEQLAAKAGATAAEESKPAAPNGDTALWERYQKADAVEQAAMREEHGDKLTASAEAYDAATAAK